MKKQSCSFPSEQFASLRAAITKELLRSTKEVPIIYEEGYDKEVLRTLLHQQRRAKYFLSSSSTKLMGLRTWLRNEGLRKNTSFGTIADNFFIFMVIVYVLYLLIVISDSR